MLASASSAQEPSPVLATFTVTEHFGVSHPDQIIDFDRPKAAIAGATRMLDAGGREVTHQILRDGRVAVRTDLPAGTTRTWRLVAGQAAPQSDAVVVSKTDAFYEITNGLTGVRIPSALPADAEGALAPVQGIRHRDGTWTASGPNHLSVPAKRMEVRMLEEGALKVVLEVSYVLDRPELRRKEAVVSAAGEGFYKCRIEVQAGQPSMLFEEEADADVAYSFAVSHGLRPNQARYRGHGSTSVERGRTADGQQYPGGGGSDGLVDLTFERPKTSGSATTDNTWRRIEPWYPWPKDGGWYWMLYDAAAPASANVLGIFARRASLAVGASHSGVGIFTTPGEGKDPVAGFTVTLARSGADARVFSRVRFAWGLFAGTKGDALLPPGEVQPIGRQWNLHGGINLNKLHRIQLEYPDPPAGYGSMFMDPAVLRRMIEKVKADPGGPSGGGYHQQLVEADPGSRELIALWADRDGAKVKAAVESIARTATGFLDAMVNGRGIFHGGDSQMQPSYGYWMGALEMGRKGLWIDQVLAHEQTTPENRAKVKAIAALFAHVLWDDDFVPLFEGHGMHLGNPNMPVAQQGMRNFFTLFLADHPAIAPRLPEVERRVLEDLHTVVNEHGASMSGVNYISAGFVPTLNTLLQLRMRGRDHFRSEPRLVKFAEFYMNLLTPPEVRFGPKRKVISVGDSSTQAPSVLGPLATGFRDAAPELSERLMGAWHAAGKPHSSFFGTTLLQIDEDAPARDPKLGDATFPGWCSILRHGWGTPNETALWTINGDFYHDHRHLDHGSVVIYALGAPLSLDWGPIYYPQVVGGFLHSMVVPEENIAPSVGGPPPKAKHGWAQDSPPLETTNFVWGLGPWTDSRQEALVSFPAGARARSHFRSPEGRSPRLAWTRTITSIRADEAHPIIVIRDTFEGPDAATGKVFTLNLAGEGAVDTPAGKMTPTMRTYDAQGRRAPGVQELPSAGTVFPLPPGLHRLGFTGQWLIDWDLYVAADEAQAAHIGNWGHYWHPGPEQAEFQKAQGREFEERQHIFRLRGEDGFRVLILPFRKGESRQDIRVAKDGELIRISSPAGETILGEDFYAFSHGEKRGLTTFGANAAGAYGLKAEGGPTEVTVEGGRASIVVHGEEGTRRVVMPGEPKVRESKGQKLVASTETGALVLDYGGGEAATLALDLDSAGAVSR